MIIGKHLCIQPTLITWSLCINNCLEWPGMPGLNGLPGLEEKLKDMLTSDTLRKN